MRGEPSDVRVNFMGTTSPNTRQCLLMMAGAAYQSVWKMSSHWFITYMFFHAHWASSRRLHLHRNDPEGTLLAIEQGEPYRTERPSARGHFRPERAGRGRSAAQELIDGAILRSRPASRDKPKRNVGFKAASDSCVDRSSGHPTAAASRSGKQNAAWAPTHAGSSHPEAWSTTPINLTATGANGRPRKSCQTTRTSAANALKDTNDAKCIAAIPRSRQPLVNHYFQP